MTIRTICQRNGTATTYPQLRLKRDLGQNSLAAFAGVLVIALAGGFWILKRSSAGSRILHRLTPETISGEAYQYYQQGKLRVEEVR